MKRKIYLIVTWAMCFVFLFASLSLSGLAQPTKGASITDEKNVFKLLFRGGEVVELFFYPGIGWIFSSPPPCKDLTLITTLDNCLNVITSPAKELLVGFDISTLNNFTWGVQHICKVYSTKKDITLSVGWRDIIFPVNSSVPETTQSCINQVNIFLSETETAAETEEDHGGETFDETSQFDQVELCEIDQVWVESGAKLNIQKAVKKLVFTLTGWQPFDEICKLKAPATATITIPSGKKYAWSSQYDSIINNKLTAEMKNNGFDLNLIKALISHESAFHSQAISTAGCIGLMQICYSSVPSATPAYQKTTCCEAGEDSPKQTCTSEVKKTKHLWQDKVYKCTPNNDDRFDPNKNIAMGLELLSKKYAQCNSVDGALSAYASGSCSSRLDYAETIQSIKNSHQNE